MTQAKTEALEAEEEFIEFSHGPDGTKLLVDDPSAGELAALLAVLGFLALLGWFAIRKVRNRR